MARSIRPPKPPPLPSTLPLENQVNRLLDRAADWLESNPLTQRLKSFESQLPEIESVDFPSPLGKIKTPHFQFPTVSPPKLDERRKEAVKAALADDLAGLVEKIPFVGAFTWPIADAVEDTYMSKLQDLLTPEEWRIFREQDKVSPLTSVAALITFTKKVA